MLLVLFTGCSTLVRLPDEPKEATAIEPQSAWASVLTENVDDVGRINFKAVAKNPAKLRAYVRWTQSHGPKSQPDDYKTQAAKLAYYINSYNALSMYNIVDAGVPESLSSLFTKLKIFINRKFVIDGTEMSLKTYEDDTIRAVGDERVHFALNCMAAGCPRLPKKPFTAAGLDKEFDAGAKLFFSEERNVRKDDTEKIVWVSEILSFFTEDFTPKHAPSLIAYINKWRRDKFPESYKVKFIPYDWTVNAQPGTAAAPASKVSNWSQIVRGSKS